MRPMRAIPPAPTTPREEHDEAARHLRELEASVRMVEIQRDLIARRKPRTNLQRSQEQ